MLCPHREQRIAHRAQFRCNYLRGRTDAMTAQIGKHLRCEAWRLLASRSTLTTRTDLARCMNADDVRLYNRALSTAEVKQLYNAGR